MQEYYCKVNEAPGNQEGGTMSELRETLAGHLKHHRSTTTIKVSGDTTLVTYPCSSHELANQILALLKKEGYVKLAKDQSVPNLEKECSGGGLYPAGYRAGVEDMLKANFKKVELEGQ